MAAIKVCKAQTKTDKIFNFKSSTFSRYKSVKRDLHFFRQATLYFGFKHKTNSLNALLSTNINGRQQTIMKIKRALSTSSLFSFEKPLIVRFFSALLFRDHVQDGNGKG